ncbi:AFR450Cp [Eremothecium gossypii ATCC 10895]|uniref:Large ribosomal subunit protein uL30m n=1 Tax=Eremothecium gossypii (strain ATCC 10895 / CBS 109.51 / FGSC 9923 / NRRL Y-1056) TaxID=284811 RepID=Q752X3_EREGS|nr:mitochondrial 54S ribosomal protein YmL33 [Eremothecium gossypii ATCC 10895]AAS53821.1 AFR450Cp [Eremothecium gossypii ATCC 10895]AEY98132.1 FAFR450Cp [Eremothecium gossypii FDAG1]
MVFYKITLARSTIGLPDKVKGVVHSLGLGKRGTTVYRKVSPGSAGSIAKIKELVKVEVTEHALTKEEQRMLRKSNPGFTVEKRV